jgi:hypothetical protein
MKIVRIIGFCVLMVSTLHLAGKESARADFQSVAAKSQTSVQSVAPQTITLTAGGPGRTVTMAGTDLGFISAVQVVQQGRPAQGFEVELAPPASSNRAFEIKAASTANPGSYQLRIIIRAQRFDLSADVASVIVKAGESRLTSARKEKATPAAPPSQAASKPGQASRALLVPKDTRVIHSTGFNSTVSTVFTGAYFNASSCGGRDSERKTTANVPNAYFKQEPLDRLEYRFTDGEKDKSATRMDRAHIRRVEIRACVDSWELALNGALIEGGQFKILFKFPKIQVINTRAMQEKTSFGIYGDEWDWSDSFADSAIQDFRFSGGLNIFLAPVVENGNLSYRVADVRWEFYEPLTGWIGPGHFRLPEVEEPKIVYYKDRSLEIIRQRVMGMFSDEGVRARLSSALTQYIKSGDFAGRTIVGVSGTGDKIQVTFQQ